PDVATLLHWVEAQVPPRLPVALPKVTVSASTTAPKTVRGYLGRSAAMRPVAAPASDPEGVELTYETLDWTPPEAARLSDAIYEEYALQSLRIPGAQPHPTK